MKKLEAGSGSYGFTYEAEVEVKPGKKEWVKYIFWFEAPEPRNVVMNSTKPKMRHSRKWKRISR